MFLVGLASCANEEARPRNLLSEKKMVEVMVDVHIFEAVAEGQKMSKDSLAVLVETNYNEIFKKHKINKEEFERTFEYYENNPVKMDEMMTQVIDELSKVEARMKGEEEVKPDSLKKQ